MTRRYLIQHYKMGLFIGEALGMGFFSLADSAGQPMAVTFESEDDARHFIKTFSPPFNKLGEYNVLPVNVTAGRFASIGDLRAAGYGDLITKMEREYLKHAEPAGTA